MPKQTDMKKCFVVAPIGDEGSETRRRSDQVFKHVITPATKECGYQTPVRADKISEPGIITSQVIQHLIDDELVIADLTGKNPNVFYELAVRHTVKKPVVQLIQSGELIPFDVAPIRTISVDLRDIDSVAACRDEIIKQIHSVEEDPTKVDSPISVAIDLQVLHRSENPLEKSNAEIISMLQDLASKLESRLSDAVDPIRRRRMRRVHPMMIDEMLHISDRSGDPVGLLMILSLFRDEFPWLYELGVDTYRTIKTGQPAEIEKAVANFRRTLELSMHSPIMREFADSEDSFMMSRELPMMLDMWMQKYLPLARKRLPNKTKKNDSGGG